MSSIQSSASSSSGQVTPRNKTKRLPSNTINKHQVPSNNPSQQQPLQKTPSSRQQQMAQGSNNTPSSSTNRLTLLQSKSKPKPQHFLTDAQTSDHTQHSTPITSSIKLSLLQQKLHRLSKQNLQLRQQIITIKANQFYTIDQSKVKQAVQENQRLKKEVGRLRRVNEELRVENQFLGRNHKHLMGRLEGIAQSDVRKSVDLLSKSRNKQSVGKATQRKVEGGWRARVVEGDDNKGEMESGGKGDSYNQQGEINSKKKRTIEHVRSNPNLRYRQEQNDEGENGQVRREDIVRNRNREQTYNNININGNKNSKKININRPNNNMNNQSKNNNNNNNNPKQLVSSSPLSNNNNTNEHFLRQFQKYQKQLSMRSTDNPTSPSPTSPTSHLLPKQSSPPTRRQRSTRSKQTSLQTILNKKKEMITKVSGRWGDDYEEKENYYGGNCGREDGEEGWLGGGKGGMNNNKNFKVMSNNQKNQNNQYNIKTSNTKPTQQLLSPSSPKTTTRLRTTHYRS